MATLTRTRCAYMAQASLSTYGLTFSLYARRPPGPGQLLDRRSHLFPAAAGPGQRDHNLPGRLGKNLENYLSNPGEYYE